MLTVWVWMMDQVIKKLAIDKLTGRKPMYYFNEKISFSLVKNRGAFLGWLKDKPAYLHVFTVLSIIMILILGIPYWTRGKGKWTGMGLALILGGALGNYTEWWIILLLPLNTMSILILRILPFLKGFS